MELVAGATKICINLQNGIYVLDKDSATGKSYLYTLLKSLHVAHVADIYPITYDINCNYQKILLELIRLKPHLIICDRFDKYYNDLAINSLVDTNSIILLDWKHVKPNYLVQYDCAFVEFKRGEITVDL